MNPLDPEDHFEPFLKKNMTNETMWAAVSAASDATAVNAEEEVLYDVWDTGKFQGMYSSSMFFEMP